MYLAGPAQRRPLSLVAITPALAGPYDYGVVVVRVAIDVDSLDAHVIAVSDTIPAIIGGIPMRMRSIQVNIDRPNFMINPTNCSPMTVDSQGIGDQGSVVGFSSYFQAANCAPLPFEPKMSVRKVGKGATGRSKNPSLEFRLRTRPGDANIKSLSVTLSKAFSIDQRHLGNLCSRGRIRGDEMRRAGGDRDRDDDDAAARPAAVREGLRRVRQGRPAAPRLHPRRPGLDWRRGRNPSRRRAP